MSNGFVTLQIVEAFMAERRKRGIGFPDVLERQFESDTHARRCQRLTIGILVSAAIYNVFLVGDWLLVPDVLALATILHLAVVTPWMLTAAWLVSKRPSPF